MGEFIDKSKAVANEAIGKAKVAAGQRADNPELILSGARQQVKGAAQKVSGAVKSAMGEKI